MFSALRQHRSFAHGIHPPEAKDDTRDLPIRQFPFAPVMIVPLQQHIGKPALPVVREGQEVERGQCIAEPDGFLSVAMHAPASGLVQRIALAPGISGRMAPAIYLPVHLVIGIGRAILRESEMRVAPPPTAALLPLSMVIAALVAGAAAAYLVRSRR